MNRLATERSPYLLQHAANPVDWYAWGDEAFARAREASRPIFLSVGYSTCHWCHVMERESFENQAVASVLNEHFVSIKVDREERPDVDRVYMMFVQATTGSGGWPMSVWLTPDLRPFYGGTYFPPSSRWGRPGFTEILQEIARVWRDERGQVEQSAGNLVERLRTLERTKPMWTVPDASALSRTVGQFRGAFDHRFGGFGEAPKFPRPSELLFLMREHARTGDPDAREMALETLRAMALGGMRDHIGGGFHRYSVDGQWRVPHFEKMLYDQAQLVLAYAEASQLSGDVSYAEIAEDTLRYVLREMTDSLGGFYSAEDADSLPPDSSSAEHKMEGAFYLWRAAEVESLFGKDDAGVVKLRFGIEADGNAPHDPQHEFTGKNLLYIARSIDEIAPETGRTPSEVIDILNGARVRLFEERLKRPRPDRDEKILSAWNGLMIAALARMGRLLRGSSAYLDAARRAATFMRERMWNPTSRSLARRYRQGEAEIDGFAEDYAFVTFGLLELFQADPDPAWLEWAVTLQRRLDELFWDEAEGGWFSTTGKDPSVLLRLKDEYDGAEPT
ncbi:MAG TPA: thioredoxin domain-containing protein, partial [Vicinamibacterales bacterium]|nr:thioredoxin domain-containing protein [Vicinamibacterales bacterium]